MAFDGGTDNVAVGDSALNMGSGNFNVALGYGAGLNFAGSNNIAIGEYAGQNVTSGTNNIEIANQGAKKDDSVIRIGDIKTQKKAFIAGINGVKVSGGVAVVVNKQGQLGVAASSESADNSSLLRSFLEEQRKVAALEAKVASLEAMVEKVSAQVQANAPAPRLAGVGN
jgi:hypothetical protein